MVRTLLLACLPFLLMASEGANPVSVSKIEPLAYRGVFAPADPLAWSVTLRNDTSVASPATQLTWSISDVTGAELTKGTLTVPELAATAEITVPLTSPRRAQGWYRLTCATLSRYAAVIPSECVKDRAASRFGLNLHGETEDPRELPLVARCGAGWVRGSALWHLVQAWKPEENWKEKAYDWSKVDAALTRREQAGLHTMGSLSFSVAVASSKDPHHANWWGQSFAPPDDLNDDGPYATYVRTQVERYKNRIHQWEQWNEPDLDAFWLGTAEEYGKLLACAVRAAHAVDPQAQVMAGGWSGSGGLTNIRDGLLSATPNLAGEIASLHDYNNTIGKLRGVKRQYEVAGAWPRPVWNTECGKEPPMEESRPLDERLPYQREQAAEMVRAITTQLAQGVERVFWFCWAWDPYALLTDNGPRPVFSGYRALSDLVDAPTPAKPLGTLDLGANAHGAFAFVFQRLDGAAVVAWMDPRASDFGPAAQTIAIPLDPGAAISVLGSDGRILPLRAKGDTLSITLSDEPLLIRITGPTKRLLKAVGWTTRYPTKEGVVASAEFKEKIILKNLSVSNPGRQGITEAGRRCAASDKKTGKDDNEKFYFFVNFPPDLEWELCDEFGRPKQTLQLRLSYLDRGNKPFGVQYGDGSEVHIPRSDSGTWKSLTVDLPELAFPSFSFHAGLRLCSWGWAGNEDIIIEKLELITKP